MKTLSILLLLLVSVPALAAPSAAENLFRNSEPNSNGRETRMFVDGKEIYDREFAEKVVGEELCQKTSDLTRFETYSYACYHRTADGAAAQAQYEAAAGPVTQIEFMYAGSVDSTVEQKNVENGFCRSGVPRENGELPAQYRCYGLDR